MALNMTLVIDCCWVGAVARILTLTCLGFRVQGYLGNRHLSSNRGVSHGLSASYVIPYH